SRILSAGSDGCLRLWDVATGKELRCFRGHREAVTSVAFSPDGRRALSCSGDGTVRLWDVATGQELAWHAYWDRVPRPRAKTPYGCELRAVAFSPDGRRALVGSATGNPVRLIRLPTVEQAPPKARDQ